MVLDCRWSGDALKIDCGVIMTLKDNVANLNQVISYAYWCLKLIYLFLCMKTKLFVWVL